VKKVLLIVILLLGVGGSAAGYYLFFVKPQKVTEVATITDDSTSTHTKVGTKNKTSNPAHFLVKDYYVKSRKIAVRNGPGDSFLPERQLYIGDAVTVFERKEDWGRISSFYVYKEGGKEMAEWVNMKNLAHTKPRITAQEQNEIISGYIGRSDDFKEYRDKFIKVTGNLLKEKVCSPDDFAELHGWMKSINYPDRNVYFVYCGGLNVSDKVYFDADSGDIFYH